MQLEKTLSMSSEILQEARKKLGRQWDKQSIEISLELRNTPNGTRMLCPFCRYTSKKNKMSAIVKNDCFKCFSCGKSRRIER